MVDSDENPTMGFIYQEMDRAKEKIRSSFNGIAKRWDKQLHRPLHAAGLYLNLILRYASGFTIDNEVTNGLYECLVKMVEDPEQRGMIDLQFEDFKGEVGSFGRE
ncbi:hypothetical protein KIW84_025175 [Lathyrus oleraceus]|uniref:Uncharacterized protein n=1 Tax=Pisum sativum TaxID=3888 RepID=A0A9D4YM53_PEA|nr:hypothetical protein KIW84_025175 [Pisum sativum]